MDKKQIDFDEATGFFQRCLALIGVLPNGVLDRRVLTAFFISTSIVHWTMCIGHAAREKPLQLESIYELVTTLGINARFYLLLSRRRAVAELFADCRDLWKRHCGDASTRPPAMDFERNIRWFFWLIFGSIFLANVLYSGAALYANHLTRVNATKHLPNHWYGVQDAANVWPGYKLVFGLQVLTCHNGGVISATVDSALPLLTSMCCGYLRALRRQLEDIATRTPGDDVDAELLDCCKFHQRILMVCDKLEKCGRPIFFVELIASGYVMSLVALKLASSDPEKLKYAPFVCLLLVHIFICQYAPDLLREEGKMVSTAAFSSTCMFVHRPSGKHLLIMIQRSQKELLMTAGGIVILSIENFGKMLTSAVSFFTAMRSITG